MNKIINFLIVLSGVVLFAACYNNKKDVSLTAATSINGVSFRDDVVPILISGACGCHNNGLTTAVQFSHADTLFYGTMLARSGVYANMIANPASGHPGEGGIFFSPAQDSLISRWITQGAKDNYTPPAITGPVTYTTNIVPIYKSVCKGASCHGGLGPTLDYATLVKDKSAVSTMMSSSGSNGHPGGTLSLDGTTTATFLAWIAQGMPQ